jgi:cystathionine beta-lyase/cystathionine gamma-synthase
LKRGLRRWKEEWRQLRLLLVRRRSGWRSGPWLKRETTSFRRRTSTEGAFSLLSPPLLVVLTLPYGFSSYNQIVHTLKRTGIEGRIVEGDDPAEFEKRIDGKTKAIYLESLGNPKGNIPDIRAFADLAHKHGIPLIVDKCVFSLFLRS